MEQSRNIADMSMIRRSMFVWIVHLVSQNKDLVL